MKRRYIRKLARDVNGATIIEFALVLPPFLILLMGVCDLAYNQYANEMLNGAVQKAARDSTIEAAEGSQAAIDGKVEKAVKAVVPHGTLTFERKAYGDFTKINRGEDYTDLDNNGICDNGEPFEDANRNGTWDADAGNAGFGAARDAVLYTAKISYRRMFPIFALIPGQSEDMTLVAHTVLRNQPYGAPRGVEEPPAGNCP